MKLLNNLLTLVAGSLLTTSVLGIRNLIDDVSTSGGLWLVSLMIANVRLLLYEILKYSGGITGAVGRLGVTAGIKLTAVIEKLFSTPVCISSTTELPSSFTSVTFAIVFSNC